MIRRTFLTIVLCVLFAPAFSFAQAADNGGNGAASGAASGGGNASGNTNNGGGNGGGGNNNGGGGRGNYDPAQFRQRMMDRMKDDLGAKDDEWKVIEPKLEKVFDASRATRGGMGFGGRGGYGGRDRGNRGDNNGGGNGGPPQQADTPVSTAMQALRDTLDNKDASADDINQKLTALRDARDKAKKDLADAQKDLKDVLTQRQEAVLVMDGLLD